MTWAEFLAAAKADQMIAIYVLSALMIAGLTIVWEVVSYFWDRWRSKRKANNIIHWDERVRRYRQAR